MKSDGELEKIATLVAEASGLKKEQMALKAELGMPYILTISYVLLKFYISFSIHFFLEKVGKSLENKIINSQSDSKKALEGIQGK
jgi:hypothetical protein